jgi:serine protease AprX
METQLGPSLTFALTERAEAGERLRPRRRARSGREDGFGLSGLRMRLPFPIRPRRPPAVASFRVTARLPRSRVRQRETWSQFRERELERLGQASEVLKKEVGVDSEPVISGQALHLHASHEEVRAVQVAPAEIELLDLDPLVDRTLGSSVAGLPDLTGYRQAGGGDGSGVRVAVVDSGIDLLHPALTVTDSASTCDQAPNYPGRHGTMVAGIIASRDPDNPGLAPGVDLLNIKALHANGFATGATVARGVDSALSLTCDVINISAGFSHLAGSTTPGPGWFCPDGQCQLCVAVRTATEVENGPIVVVAAGNEHMKAEALRKAGQGSNFDTELACPGQSPDGLSVAAIDGSTNQPADFTSHGPTAMGTVKPDLAAPGVSITSIVPAKRTANGTLAATSGPAATAVDSGTSFAAPIVAAYAALIWQELAVTGQAPTAASVRAELLKRVQPLSFPPQVVGSGVAAI